MVYELVDTTKAAALFGGWSETLIWSCLQKVMGKIYVTDFEKPQSALAFVGCFAFYAGEPDRELVMHKPAGTVSSCFCRVFCLLCRRAGSRACNA